MRQRRTKLRRMLAEQQATDGKYNVGKFAGTLRLVGVGRMLKSLLDLNDPKSLVDER